MKKFYILILAAALTLTFCSCASKKQAETEHTETTAAEMTEPATEPTTEPTETTEPEETTEPTEATEPEPFKGIAGVVVNANTLNVRSDAGVNKSLVTKLSLGTSVTVYEKTLVDSTYWGRIDQGWVSLDYIRLDGTLDAIPLKGADSAATTNHEHDYRKTVTQPTCTERGYNTYTCECGETYKDSYIDALGHTWGSWTTIKEATQYACGRAERKCSRCGSIEERTIDKLVANHTHSYTSTVTTQATCSRAGIRTYTCSCGSTYTESIAKTSHNYKTQTVAPTCQHSGYTLHTCTVCGDSYKDNYTEAAAHNYKAEVTAASCEKAGQTKYTCQVCGNSYTDNITAATGHCWNGWVTIKEPTVSDTGLKERSCTTCGKTETETIARLSTQTEDPTPTEHTHVWVHYHEDEVGHWEGFISCVCGAKFYSNDEWIAHVKSYDNSEAFTNHGSCSSGYAWVVDTPAKDWDECSVCGAIQ